MEKEGLHKERVPIRALADYVLRQGNWHKINDLRTIGSTLCIVNPKSESQSWDIFLTIYTGCRSLSPSWIGTTHISANVQEVILRVATCEVCGRALRSRLACDRNDILVSTPRKYSP